MTTKNTVWHRLAVVLLGAALVMLGGPAATASAHGEQTQEAFLRASSVLLYDVRFSATELNIGDELTITGRMRVMNSWPEHTIRPPEMGFLSIIAPGPVFGITDRRMNEQFVPQSVEIEKGQTFPFSITAIAREEGRWHVHPSFAVEGTGTLVGRGEWIEVGPGSYDNTAVLASGDEVDLKTYGNATVWVWHSIAIVIALAWLVFWLRRPVIARLGYVAAGDTKLNTTRDVVVGLSFAGLIFAVIIGGNIYAHSTARMDPMPLQVNRVKPVAEEATAPLVKPRVTNVAYRVADDSLTMTVRVENTSKHAVRLSQLQVAEEALLPVGATDVPQGATKALTLSDDSPIKPGETRELTVRIDTAKLKERNLLPLAEPQVKLTGLMFFTDSEGNRQVSEVDEVTAPILPTRE